MQTLYIIMVLTQTALVKVEC